MKYNIEIYIANWDSDKDSLSKIRRRVFIEEQNVPEDMEWDEHDNASTHFLATHKDRVVACARLKTDGQIGRMAVLAEYRNKGIGSKLLQFCDLDSIQHSKHCFHTSKNTRFGLYLIPESMVYSSIWAHMSSFRGVKRYANGFSQQTRH